jgi:hypothetical protein
LTRDPCGRFRKKELHTASSINAASMSNGSKQITTVIATSEITIIENIARRSDIMPTT